jgi:hypothetical protein
MPLLDTRALDGVMSGISCPRSLATMPRQVRSVRFVDVVLNPPFRHNVELRRLWRLSQVNETQKCVSSSVGSSRERPLVIDVCHDPADIVFT